MLLRCSICRGQFDVEPSPNKPTVFCPHCGAPLDMRQKSKRVRTTNAPALQALGDGSADGESAGPGAPAESLDSLFTPAPARHAMEEAPVAPRRIVPSPVQARPTIPFADETPGNAPAAVDTSNPLASLASAGSRPGAGGPVRRQIKKKNNSSNAVVVIVVTGVICTMILVGVVIYLNSNPQKQEEAPPVKVIIAPPAHQPGELFQNVPSEK